MIAEEFEGDRCWLNNIYILCTYFTQLGLWGHMLLLWESLHLVDSRTTPLRHSDLSVFPKRKWHLSTDRTIKQEGKFSGLVICWSFFRQWCSLSFSRCVSKTVARLYNKLSILKKDVPAFSVGCQVSFQSKTRLLVEMYSESW